MNVPHRRLPDDESVPAHESLPPGHPLVVFNDHRFSAGRSLEVMCMPGPHMHSQVEINLLLQGDMAYWFDGHEIALEAGRLVMFWGMSPHQVVRCAQGTRFVCLYVPISILFGVPDLRPLREAVFAGAMAACDTVRPFEADLFSGWRLELLGGDPAAENIVGQELVARMRRIAREGWSDLRPAGKPARDGSGAMSVNIRNVQTMARYIGQRACEDIDTADVAAAASLHPNYAMQVFKHSIGLTIHQAILRQRLDTALSLLIATETPVTQVALESGFKSLSSFYDAFAKRFGKRPGAVRDGAGLLASAIPGANAMRGAS